MKNNGMQVLFKECDRNAGKLYPKTDQPRIITMSSKELEVIESAGLGRIFLSAKKLMDYAKAQKIILMPSFPAAGTMVSYLCGIGNIEPVRHGFVSERYLNPLRPEVMQNPRFLCSPSAKEELDSYVKSLNSGGECMEIEIWGLAGFEAVEKIIDSIRNDTGNDLDFYSIEPNEPQVFSIFNTGDTEGIWEFGLPQQTETCNKAGVESFEDLIAISSLCHPGTDHLIPEFIERKKGRLNNNDLHAVAEPFLNETYGLMLYQEQMIRIYAALSGCSLAEADIVRKNMGAKKIKALEADRNKFIDGCLKKEIPPGRTESLWDFMSNHSPCCFLKQYSAESALFAYRMAYLKKYYQNLFLKHKVLSIHMDRQYEELLRLGT